MAKGIPLKKAEIIAECGFHNKQQKDVAEQYGVHPATVKRYMNSEEAHQLLGAALFRQEFKYDDLAKKMIDMLEQKKEGRQGGDVNDNVAQLGAVKEINTVLGTYAPTNLNLRHSAGPSDAEVDKALTEEAERLGMDEAEQGDSEPDTPEAEGPPVAV